MIIHLVITLVTHFVIQTLALPVICVFGQGTEPPAGR